MDGGATVAFVSEVKRCHCFFFIILLETGGRYIQLEAHGSIRSSISSIWLDCSIRVFLNLALRKHEKLNNLLPQFFCVYTSRHLIDTYSTFCVIAGGEIFFLLNRLRVFNTLLTLSNSSTKLLGNQISRYESYPIFLVCIKCCAIASHNLLSRYIENKHEVITFAFCKGNIWGNCW